MNDGIKVWQWIVTVIVIIVLVVIGVIVFGKKDIPLEPEVRTIASDSPLEKKLQKCFDEGGVVVVRGMGGMIYSMDEVDDMKCFISKSSTRKL